MDSFSPLRVEFTGEQDGAPEREFKARLVSKFRSDANVVAAYLARACYGDCAEEKVVLCLGVQDNSTVDVRETIGAEFRAMFGTHESLDILFMSPKQREKIQLVARPFYVAAAHADPSEGR